MRDYGKVFSAFWQSEDMRSLSEDGRTMALYLMTCPHGNMLGCFRLTDAYAGDDLQWEPERVRKGLGELFGIGFAYRCDRTFWLFIRKFLEWNPFENPNVATKAFKLAESLRMPNAHRGLLAQALRDFGRHFGPEKLNAFETLVEPFDNPFDTVSKTITITIAPTIAATGAIAVSPQSADAIEPGKVERRKTRRFTPEDEACARWLFGCNLSVNPEAKQPNWNTWSDEVRLMREQDKRTHRAICELYAWAKKDGFWSPNIQSPGKLREKWDQLTEQRIRAGKPNGRGTESIEDRNARIRAEVLGTAAPIPDDGLTLEMEPTDEPT